MPHFLSSHLAKLKYSIALATLGVAYSASSAEIDPARSLFITDTQILNTFSASDVFTKLLNDVGDTTTTLADISTWQPQGCDTVGGNTFNGFPSSCRTVFFGNLDDFAPIAITNRFDLAPADGSNCGEYRIAFARTPISNPGVTVTFMILENQLPNPNPQAGREGCRAIADFWANLSTVDDANQRATALHQFFFDGINGIPAAIDADHLAGGETGSGQIRFNIRESRLTTWSQFEFRTVPTPGQLSIVKSTVKDTPFDELASDTSTHALAGPFKQAVLDALAVNGQGLLANSMSDLAINLPNEFAKGRSFSDEFGTDTQGGVLGHFDSAGNFAANIQAQLSAVGSNLTPDHVIARVNALSCGGCHNQGRDLGGAIPFTSNDQVSEFLNFQPESLTAATHIEAENFVQMSGVELEAANDTSLPPSQRVNDKNIGWLDAGDWVTYNVALPASTNGQYEITYRVASDMTGGRLQLEAPGGQSVYGQLDVPNTGGWQQWQSIKHTVTIPAGQTQLAIAVLNGGWNLNFFDIRGVVAEHYPVKRSIRETFLPERKAFLESFLAACENCQVNLLNNPTFENNGEGWQTYIDQAANASFSLDGVARLTSYFGGTEIWHAQVYQGGLALEQGKTYRLQFVGTTYGKTTSAQFSVHVEENGGAYTQYMPAQTFNVDLSEPTFEITFTAPQTVNNARVTFNMGLNNQLGGGMARVLGVRDVQLFELP